MGNGAFARLASTLRPRQEYGRSPARGKSRRSSCATVPGTSGRADVPSAKKSLGSSGSYLGWSYMSLRQPHKVASNTLEADPA